MKRRIREGERPPYSQVGRGAAWEGRISGGGMLIVLGEVRTAVAIDGEVIVAATGTVVASSGRCRTLRVEGGVGGAWSIAGTAEVAPGGRLSGALEARSVRFSDKAVIEGPLKVGVRPSNTD